MWPMSMDRLRLSQDGSHTIESEVFGVSYHSKYGAIQETETVFINAGLRHVATTGLSAINILEMGFGTGLNAIMTLLQQPIGTSVTYHTLEAYPISTEEYKALNYPNVLPLSAEKEELFYQMHAAEGSQRHQLTGQFDFVKHLVKLEDFETAYQYDLIYYDAFAPTSQPHLWTDEMMHRVSKLCKPGAILVTYCAKGSFKRALKAAGFKVEGLPGPIGKREMTRATFLAAADD